jgi:prepilin peptidase CpaA
VRPIEPVQAVLAVVLTGLLAWAAASDIRVRKIPNGVVLAIGLLFAAWSVSEAGAGLPSALLAGLIAFAVGFGLYLGGIVGAGDSKLFAVVALFAGVPLLPFFAVATAMTGGAMGVVSVASRPRRALVMLTLRGKGDFGRGIPYGVAIAVGGALTIWLKVSGLDPARLWSAAGF